MNEINIKKDDENVEYLISQLKKEVMTKDGFIGIDFTQIEREEGCPTRTEALFQEILDGVVIFDGNSQAYVRESEYEVDMPFKTESDLKQHMNRFGEFVEKFAPDYLPKERAEDFIKEIQTYLKTE